MFVRLCMNGAGRSGQGEAGTCWHAPVPLDSDLPTQCAGQLLSRAEVRKWEQREQREQRAGEGEQTPKDLPPGGNSVHLRSPGLHAQAAHELGHQMQTHRATEGPLLSGLQRVPEGQRNGERPGLFFPFSLPALQVMPWGLLGGDLLLEKSGLKLL